MKKQEMNDKTTKLPVSNDDLFSRVASILETARENVVRSVNSNMVLSYWLIGREIVLDLQNGAGRAEYGKQVLDTLSNQLTRQYGKGFSVTNLKYFSPLGPKKRNKKQETGKLLLKLPCYA